MVAVPRPNKKAEKIVHDLIGTPATAKKTRRKKNPIFEIGYPSVGNRPIFSMK